MSLIKEQQLEGSKRRTPEVLKNINVKQGLEFTPAHLLRVIDPDVRNSFLFAGGAKPSGIEFERILGANDLVDEFFFERALLVGKPICRIAVRHDSGAIRGWATGFMVSPRLMLTNHHVFATPEDAAPSLAEFNYRLGVAGEPEKSYRFKLRPDQFFLSDEGLDFAMVAVEPVSLDGAVGLSSFGYHRLLARSGKVVPKEWLSIVQHPGGAYRQWAIRENQCIDATDPNFIWYMSDTAPGSSGAPVLNDSFQVVALHHSGKAQQDTQGRFVLKDGSTRDSLDGVAEESIVWIANEGVRISSICAYFLNAAPAGEFLTELKAAMEGGDVLSAAYSRSHTEIASATAPHAPISIAQGRLELGTLVLELKGRAPELSALSAAVLDSGALEAFREPIVDRDYVTRAGFNADFLELPTPLPEVIDKDKVVKMKGSSEYVIPYEHFSVVLHAERKLALYTASNVDWNETAKNPEPGLAYSRKSLGGLGKNDQEKWLLDPRVPEENQVPDKFYTNDNKAFDKGHLVRRDDVCWGSTYAEVQRANGDTYHVTNCSPQVKGFNQAAESGVWGQLENHIGKQAKAERLCIFAGPVLSDSDKVFAGTEDVRIPVRYWKVICAVSDGQLQVFPFLLEQDLSSVPLEFSITPEWRTRLVSLNDLEGLIGLLAFPGVYHDADRSRHPDSANAQAIEEQVV
ncbi:DNA/RNA non-specific endonuclease [Pseudomonas sp. Q1-7]|uniref:DNA/RNA non-specific endonuclease n=1 Tax=Pseudomonas sp. Q1-7 TaxID=3020843 RepID=UPI0022FFFAE3|nr:DNA/RNA non-specific endonuclease [Pseudomonas sp. Q1-7]